MNAAATAPGGDFLAEMAQRSRARVALARARVPESALRGQADALPAAVPLRFSDQGFDLIAELKRRSPAAGALAGSALDQKAQACAYLDGGAAALSVLTEPERFDGELAHLAELSAASPDAALMRKDFIVDRYQLLEARVAGASGVLLIATMLEPAQLDELLADALALGLFVLVEAFDAPDLEVCVPIMQKHGAGLARERLLLGINCRDLKTLQVDFARFSTLAPELPAGFPRVAESGVGSPEQAAEVARLGYDVALVGTALMRSGDPAAMTASLLAAGRAVSA